MLWRLLLREPDDASLRGWLCFVGRLTVAYLGTALIAGAFAILIAAVMALTIGHAPASVINRP